MSEISTGRKRGREEWRRVAVGGQVPAVDRACNEDEIETLLAARSEAKTAKRYAESDKIGETLQRLDVCYFDAKKEWYTRAPSGGAASEEAFDEQTSRKQRRRKVRKKRSEDKAAAAAAEKAAKKETRAAALAEAAATRAAAAEPPSGPTRAELDLLDSDSDSGDSVASDDALAACGIVLR